MKAVRLVGLFITIASASLLAQSTSVSQMMQVRHWNGQSVAPVYEGFDINADGRTPAPSLLQLRPAFIDPVGIRRRIRIGGRLGEQVSTHQRRTCDGCESDAANPYCH